MKKIILLFSFYLLIGKDVTVTIDNKNVLSSSINSGEILRLIGDACIEKAERLNPKSSDLKNGLKIAGIIFGCLYIYKYINLNSMNQKIQDKDSWSCWKINLTLEQLLQSSKEELKAEILQDAKRFYKDSVISPHISLQDEVIKEKEALKSYLNFIKQLQNYHLTLLFPINNENIKLAQEKLNRLSFIRGLIS